MFYYAPRVEIGTTNTLSFLLYANAPVAADAETPFPPTHCRRCRGFSKILVW